MNLKILLLILTVILFWQCRHEVVPEPTVNIKDNKFLDALIYLGVDKDKDSIISPAEAEIVRSLNISGYNISDLTGIKYFINLETLFCSQNLLTILDLSGNTALKKLDIQRNQLIVLDISHNTALEELFCNDNNLRYI